VVVVVVVLVIVGGWWWQWCTRKRKVVGVVYEEEEEELVDEVADGAVQRLRTLNLEHLLLHNGVVTDERADQPQQSADERQLHSRRSRFGVGELREQRQQNLRACEFTNACGSMASRME
jgi:hypothetical protein